MYFVSWVLVFVRVKEGRRRRREEGYLEINAYSRGTALGIKLVVDVAD